MIIVANSYMLNKFSKIKIFTLDLGQALINLKTEKLDIKDTFMLKYFGLTGKQILTFGIIGKLKFYQDFTLSNNEFYIFNKDSIYGLTYQKEDENQNIEDYLAGVVREINEKEGITNSEEMVPIIKPNIELSRDQYLQEMIKKRQNN